MNYIIDFIDTATQEQIDDYLSRLGANITKTFQKFHKIYCVHSPVPPQPDPIVQHIINDDDHSIKLLDITVVADANYGKIATDGSVDIMNVPNDDKNWWKFYTFVEADLDSSVYSTNRKGSSSVVYVLDSGIEISHPEFQGTQVSNLWSFTGDFTDTKGHGTAIASVISGITCGVTNAAVKSVKIFDTNVTTKQSDMLAGLDAIYHDFVANNVQHAVVNCSWAISKNTYIESKIQDMIDAGLFFVAAAGNNGVPIDDVTPASMADVITIGSYNNNLTPSNFSDYTGDSGISLTRGATNHGELDCWAPGEQIWAAGLSGTYKFVVGTSIAAGIHSAAVAYNRSYIDESWSNVNYKQIGVGRQGLLDLSDPKYQSSVNKVTTLLDKLPNFSQTIPLMGVVKIPAGMFINLKLFNPHVVKQITFKGNLPAGLSVNSAGSIYGTVTSIEGKVQYVTIPVDVEYHDGTTESTDVKIVTHTAEFDKKTDTTGDPVLDIVLNEGFSCYNEEGVCIRQAPADVCIDDCASVSGIFGAYCFGGGTCPDKSERYCQCFGI